MALTRSSVLGEIIEQSRAYPDHLAATDLERALSYASLVDEAARLGAGLRDQGVHEGDRVALFIPNSVDFIVAALACLWIGAVFVPLAVTDPVSRLRTVVLDAAPALILVPASSDSPAPESLGDVRTVPLDRLRATNAFPALDTDAVSRAAYMIYTSGTTGTPKGVEIGSAAFAAAVDSTASALGLDRNTRTLCVSPFHFDGSYANLFSTLISGGRVVIRPRDALLFPRTFFNTVANEKITYSGFTPSYLRLLLASRQFSSLRGSTLGAIALGGEALTVVDVRAVWSHLPLVRLFNRYGPTETTIAVTNVELTPELVSDGTVPIGRPHPGVSFTLVDDDGRIVSSANQAGELCIGGVQLMDGYWRAPTLTRNALRDDVVLGETVYRSGDLVYRDERGNYVYVDRIDRVVKRSGVRISLVELSESLSKLGDITAAACLSFDQDGELGIAAFVVTDIELSSIDLRRAALRLIPENMLPDRFVFVDEMPLDKSNQMDEARLLSAAGLRPYHPGSA